MKREFDPGWNNLPRTLLMYVIPLFTLGLCLELDIIKTMNFYFPLACGWFFSIFSTTRLGGKIWILKDYQNRDTYLLGAGLNYATLWCLSDYVFGEVSLKVITFTVVYTVIDYFMIRYKILRMRTYKKRYSDLIYTLMFAPFLWIYMGISFHFHQDRNIIFAFLITVTPIQLLVSLLYYFFGKDKKINHIKNVAVIGSGFSGVYATKWLKQAGLNVKCFEKDTNIGGVWNYSHDKSESGSVFKYTRQTSSKHFLHATDFKVPFKGDFLNHTDVFKFLEEYVRHNNLESLIEFNSHVDSIKKLGDKWDISINGTNTSFDAVVIATGPQGTPRINPNTDDIYKNFSGTITHAAEYKDSSSFKSGDKVLVVGAGESSADIVTEIVHKVGKLHWSARRGQWFADRYYGPFAVDHLTGFGLRSLLGRFFMFEYITRRYFVQNFLNFTWGRGGHGIKMWMPKSPHLHQFLNKSREFIYEVYKGSIETHKKVIKIEGNNVYFEDENTPITFDHIILATGFKPNWSLLEDKCPSLFKLVFKSNDSINNTVIYCIYFIVCFF